MLHIHLDFFRRAQGIIRLFQSGKVSREGLEHGSQMAMTFNKAQYKFIQSIAEHFDKKLQQTQAGGYGTITR